METETNSTATASPIDVSALQSAGPSAGGSMPAPNAPIPPTDIMSGATEQAPPNIGGPDTGINPAVPPTPPAGASAGGHQRLARMIQALSAAATGVGAAAHSMATGGREGGVEEVIRVQGEEQRQRIAEQQAGQAAKNAELQRQLMTGQLAEQNFTNHMHLASMSDMLLKGHFETVTARLEAEGRQTDADVKAQEMWDTRGFVPEGYIVDPGTGKAQKTTQAAPGAPTAGAAPAGTSPAGTPNVLPGLTPGAPSAAAANAPVPRDGQYFLRQQAIFDASAQAIAAANNGKETPLVAQARQVMNAPESTVYQIQRASIMVQNAAGLSDATVKRLKDVAESQTAQRAADPLSKLESDPSEMTGDKAPAAVALLSSKLADPNLPSDQKPRVQRLLTMANQAQKNALAFDAAKERTKQAITDGDPKAAGALLVSGLVAPSQLVSSRKPQFAQAALDEAVKQSGGKWSAVKAESQYKYAENPKTQNTLNLLTTMQNPGGSIDIAQQMFNTIPGKMDVKAFNKITTGAVTQFGGTSTVAFQAAMTSLADEYAQVLQGGAATETTLKQAHDLIQQAYTKTQGAAAFDTIRLDMAARQKGMVRDNPALNSMYPNVAVAPAGGVSSGHGVSLASARQLPAMKGKSDNEIKAAIQAQGHQVLP